MPIVLSPLVQRLRRRHRAKGGVFAFAPTVFSRDVYQPSVKLDDAPKPEETSAQPEVPTAAEGEALRVEGEQNGVAPNQNWQTPYLEYLLRGELPLDKAEARRLARRAKLFVLLGDEKELYHRSPSGILQRCISIAQGQELLQEIHSVWRNRPNYSSLSA
jgi:hypothetical protein